MCLSECPDLLRTLSFSRPLDCIAMEVTLVLSTKRFVMVHRLKDHIGTPAGTTGTAAVMCSETSGWRCAEPLSPCRFTTMMARGSHAILFYAVLMFAAVILSGTCSQARPSGHASMSPDNLPLDSASLSSTDSGIVSDLRTASGRRLLRATDSLTPVALETSGRRELLSYPK